MVRFTVEVDSIINASAADVYSVLADYNHGHPHIMPKEFCDGLEVKKGSGVGEKTRIEAHFNIYGQRDTLIMDVSEPEPGRVLQEIDTKAINITRFIVDPIDQATSRVTIQTKVMKQTGVPPGPFLDMWLKRMVLKKIFTAELEALNDFMTIKSKQESADF